MQASSTTARAPVSGSKIFECVSELAALDPALPLGAIQVLLYVAENRGRPEGVNIKNLKADLGLTSTIASRHIAYIGPGRTLELLEVKIDPADRRRRLLDLTTYGEYIVTRLETIIDKG